MLGANMDELPEKLITLSFGSVAALQRQYVSATAPQHTDGVMI